MRWFLADEAAGLESALVAAGEQICSSPERWASRFVLDAGFRPADYPLAELALGAGADVVVLVDPIRSVPFEGHFAEFGYARGHGKTLRNRGVTLVMFAHDCRATLEAFRAGMHRRCACEVNDVAVHIVPDASVGDLVRGSRRVAVWAGGTPAPLLAAVEHARSGQVYLPRRDGRLWG